MSTEELVSNGTEADFVPLHLPENEGHFFHFNETAAPLTILGCILVCGFLKAGFRYCKVPHSVILLIFGIASGALVSYVVDNEVYLHPQWFFYYLLPPIVLEAGYFLKNKDFFMNIGAICTFAVIGTLFNIAALSLSLYFARDWFNVSISFIEIAVFSTLICAVDPVAVLCVFEDIHVNELLYICVFGESLLNDAVTIVLYSTLIALVPTPAADGTPVDINLGPREYLDGFVYFFKVSFGGIFMGIAGGYLTVIFMRLLHTHAMVQPINLICMPIMIYLLTESMHLSAILAIVTCGILIKNYMQGNVNEQIQGIVEFCLKIGSSYAESFVFIFLGLSAVSSQHEFDLWFVIITLLGCFMYRFMGVYLLCFILNKFRLDEDKIDVEDQFVMAYGGIRGAVCYGLVMAIDIKVFPAKRMFITTTIIVILFTTFIQGSTIKYIVEKFKVKRSKHFGKDDNEKLRVFDYFINQANKHMVAFLEDLTGLHQHNYIYRKMLDFDEKIVKPLLVANYRRRECGIISHHQKIEIEEYSTAIRSGGSFAGLPTISSVANIQGMRYSKSEAVLMPRYDDSPEPSERSQLIAPPPSQRSIPRNESITGFVRDTFENINQITLKEKRRSTVYSRHVLDWPQLNSSMIEEPDLDTTVAEESENYLNTYPYSKKAGTNLAQNIKQFGKSLRDKQRTISPRRGVQHRASVSGAFRSQGSSARATTAPPTRGRCSLPTSSEGFEMKKRTAPRVNWSTEDETIEPESSSQPASARSNRNERKVSSGRKTFIIGGDESRDLNPIDEEDRDESLLSLVLGRPDRLRSKSFNEDPVNRVV